MFTVNEVVVYRKEIYRIDSISKKSATNRACYFLLPYYPSAGLEVKLQVPVDNRMGHLRKLSSKEEVEALLNNLVDIPEMGQDGRLLESDYHTKMEKANLYDLVSIMKTTYSRISSRKLEGKKSGVIDGNYFEKAEKLLFDEIGAVLEMNPMDVRTKIYSMLDTLA